MQGGACELKPALGKYLGISASYPQDPRSDQCHCPQEYWLFLQDTAGQMYGGP